jgi:hypothetical protein
MLAPPEVPRNAERAESEGRASKGIQKSAAKDSIKADIPKDPGPEMASDGQDRAPALR